jgi:ABC-type spermidine/putrescine transport system permease subunit II
MRARFVTAGAAAVALALVFGMARGPAGLGGSRPSRRTGADSARSIGQVEFGLALIGAFGVGMAVAMVTVGLGLVLATRFGQRRFGEGVVSRRLSIALPAVMAMVVTGVGAVLLISAGETLLR